MSITAEKIERISDAGVFETLGIRVLREIDEDCRAIIHTGLNVAGKPIPDPVDGFGRVPGSGPSKYMSAAFTTTSIAELEQKWLSDGRPVSKSRRGVKAKSGKRKPKHSPKELGDLVKAARNAADIRAVEPDAHFIVYLCTNRCPKTALLKKVYIAAAQLKLEVRFLDQTRARDFLDKPEGQWLRREHLSIAVEQLSASLLKAASEASVAEYEKSLLMPGDRLVSTEQSKRVLSALQNRSSSLYFLVGPSGIGKSVIGAFVQRDSIEGGRFALWIPGEVVDRSTSLSDALNSVLHSLYPTLAADAGLQALKIAAGGTPLMLIVDDINRLPAPQNALIKLLRWARPHESARGTSSLLPPLQIVCPVWDSLWASFRQIESQSWIEIQPLQAFLRSESLEILRAGIVGSGKLHETELDGLASELKDDPILLTLFIDAFRRTPTATPSSIAGDVLNCWVRGIAGELSAKTNESATEYLLALEHLAAQMVIRRSLYPALADVRSWFSSNSHSVRLLLLLADAGHLCRITNRDNTPAFEFRHDRILGFFIANALAGMLGNPGSIDSAVWDPFFTFFLGEGIARRTLADATLDEVLAHNPNALIAALRYLDAADGNYFGGVTERIRAWLAGRSSASPHVWHYGISLLRDTTGSAVLTVTDGLKDGPVLLEARLRNGDVRAGASVLASRFWPSSGAAWMEAIIAQAVMRHGSRMMLALQALLGSASLSDGLRSGALVLAGYIGSGQLITGVRKCWELSRSKKDLVLPALWAVLRCAETDAGEHLETIMPSLFEIEHDPTGQTYSRRQSVLQSLGWSARHGFAKPALEHLVVLGKTEQYRGIVMGILSEIPDATAVRFVVRELAQWQNDARQAGSISPFAIAYSDRWKDWRAQGRISDACAAALRKMWEDATEAEWVREYALRIWNIAARDLGTLRSIARHDVLYKSALYDRMVLGDRSVIPDIVPELQAKPWWLEQIHKIWSDELEAIVRQRLDDHLSHPPATTWSNEDVHLAHVLRDIPVPVSEKLLVDYWEKLRARPLFVQAALYLSTDKTRALASTALQDADKELLKFIDGFFGFMSLGLSDRLSLQHLESLRPYLALMDHMAIGDLIDFCGRHSYLAWAETYLLPEYERRRSESAGVEGSRETAIIEHYVVRWMPSKSQLFAQLDDLAAKELGTAIFLLQHLSEDFSARGATLESLCTTAREWFGRNPIAERLPLFAAVIQYWGTRPNLVPLGAAYHSMGDPLISPTYRDVQFTVERRSLS